MAHYDGRQTAVHETGAAVRNFVAGGESHLGDTTVASSKSIRRYAASTAE